MRVADAIVRTPKWMAVPGILIAAAVAMQNPAGAGEPSTSVQTEYLMTLHVPLAPPLAIDQSMAVIGASTPGGWVEGGQACRAGWRLAARDAVRSASPRCARNDSD
jgi:hypothetical protein